MILSQLTGATKSLGICYMLTILELEWIFNASILFNIENVVQGLKLDVLGQDFIYEHPCAWP